MKFFKKSFALALSVLLAGSLVFVSCGGDSDSSSEDK